MDEGSRGRGRNQQGFQVGCCEMVGDYNNDSSSEENLNFLLRLTRVEANVDLKKTRARVLEGHLQDQGGVGGFHDNS